MRATQLLADLTRLGIRIEARGDRLRYSPRAAVTPELAQRMQAHKVELLALILQEIQLPIENVEDELVPLVDGSYTSSGWEEKLPLLPEPCKGCDGLDMWWNTFGTARCMRCDPPDGRSEAWRELAARLRGQLAKPDRKIIRPGACDRCRSSEFRDVQIHDGQSLRRDCAKCGRFLGFPRWYAVDCHVTGREAQHS